MDVTSEAATTEDISIRINFEARFKKSQKLVEAIYARVAELVLGYPPPAPPGWSMVPHVTASAVAGSHPISRPSAAGQRDKKSRRNA
jgi:hypothetical protein